MFAPKYWFWRRSCSYYTIPLSFSSIHVISLLFFFYHYQNLIHHNVVLKNDNLGKLILNFLTDDLLDYHLYDLLLMESYQILD